MKFTCRTVTPLESPWIEVEETDLATAIQEVQLQFVLRRSPYGGLCCPVEEHGTIWLAHFAVFEIGGHEYKRISRCYSYKMDKVVRIRAAMGLLTVEQIATALGWPAEPEKLLGIEEEDWGEGEKKWRLGPKLATEDSWSTTSP